MDIDKSDNIYLCGETSSTDFPIYGKSFNLSSYGGIFVTKIKADGSGLVSSTVLGGNGADWPYSIVIDDINNTYVTGWTSSADFPTTPNAFDRRLDGGHDVFILKLNASWNAIDYSTLVGGSGDEIGGGIKLDSDGNICVAGSTNSSDFPVTSGAYDPTINGAWDFFAFKLNSSGDKMLFSTFIGGKSDDGILVGDNLFTKVGIDGSNDFIITGESYSMDFPLTPSADESTRRWSVLLKLKSDGSALEYSSYLANGTPLSMELDSSGDLYATGYTTDSQFPTTPNAYDQTLNGASDIFFLKFRMPSRPSVPRNLSATQGDGYQILNWSAPASNGYKPVTGYLVYRGLQADNITKVATLGNVTSFNDSGLVNGRTYSYQLSALNAVGEGNRTAVFNYTTGTFPNPPTDLKSAGGNRFVNISWTAPADTKGFPIVNYSIYKGVGDGQNLTRCATIENITFFNDTAATNGLNHYYAVTAINARGESRKSPVKYALPGAVPSAPASLSALEGDGYVLIGWEPPNDDGGMPVQKYRIYEVKNGMPGLLEETTDLFWNVSEVKNGEPSIFAVSAINAIGEGELTPPITAIPGLVPDAPVLTLNGGNGIIELSWAVKYNGGLPVTRYDVFKSDKSASKVEFLFNTTETGYTDLTVMNGDTYYYAVSAANLKGEGARSPVKSATPVGDGRIPGLPVNLTGNPGNGYATISWSAPTDSGGLKDIEYKIYKGESEDSLSLLMDTSQTAFNDTRVINDVAYFYAVSAVNAIGEGSRTPTIQVMPKGDGRIPGIPLDFSVERVNNSIHLKWSEPTDYGGLEISTYNIYKGTDQTNIVKITSTPALTYLDNDWQYGTRYHYVIKSVNGFGESAPSEGKDIALYDLPSEALNLTATTGYNYVLLKWSPPERKGGYDIKEYQIFKAQAKQDFTLLKSLKELEFNDTKVSNGFNYSYKIAAVNDLGSGPFSASVNATPGFTPGRPMNLKVEVQDGKVVMKWDPPGDKGGFKILEYRIYRGSSGKDLRLLASVNGTAFTDNNVAEGKKYYYSINAVNERGEGPASELKSITVPETLGIDAGMTVAISTAVILIVAVVVVVLLISRRRKSISNKTQGEDEKARGK
jgi:fibronectin type 3 domain-containing protein